LNNNDEWGSKQIRPGIVELIIFKTKAKANITGQKDNAFDK